MRAELHCEASSNVLYKRSSVQCAVQSRNSQHRTHSIQKQTESVSLQGAMFRKQTCFVVETKTLAPRSDRAEARTSSKRAPPICTNMVVEPHCEASSKVLYKRSIIQWTVQPRNSNHRIHIIHEPCSWACLAKASVWRSELRRATATSSST